MKTQIRLVAENALKRNELDNIVHFIEDNFTRNGMSSHIEAIMAIHMAFTYMEWVPMDVEVPMLYIATKAAEKAGLTERRYYKGEELKIKLS